MSLINLTAGELVALFGTVSAVLVTLYLLDRSRRKQVVATLRFWRHSESTTELRQRRRIQQPWSLVLQLISMLLLLLAIAQLQWGDLTGRVRDHVLILDTSAWMASRHAGSSLMEEARAAALAYVRSVPSADRVLLLRADGLATPVTAMESNHAVVEHAIRASSPSASALNLDQALDVARRALARSGRTRGEIVYAGPGRLAASDTSGPAPQDNFRLLLTPGAQDNIGIRKIGLRRSTAAPDQWDVFISVRNYGGSDRSVPIAVQFGGAPVASRLLMLKPNADQEATFSFRTQAAGLLEARLMADDAFPADNRAVLEIPRQGALRVIAYATDPESLRPVLAANPRVATQYRSPAAFDPSPDADVVLLQGFAPPSIPKLPSIWIDVPPAQSPVPVKTTLSAAKLTGWNHEHELGAGLRTRDLELERASVFATSAGDIAVAQTDKGPVIVARTPTGAPKFVVLGFNPGASKMRYELATPLLFANLMRWVRPEIFQRWELNAGSVGTVEMDLAKGLKPDSVRLNSDTRNPVPYTIASDHLRFYSAEPGVVRVQAGDREVVYSLTLPDPGLTVWQPPASVRKGLPRFTSSASPIRDLWPWLAILGAIGLIADWILFGRGRWAARVVPVAARARQKVLQRRAS